MNESIKNIIDAFTTLLAMIFSLFTGDTGEVISYVTTSLTTAFEKQGTTKATPLQIVNQGFAVASSISTELNAPKVTVVINALQKTEQDAVAEKVFPLIIDLKNDYEDIKAAV